MDIMQTLLGPFRLGSNLRKTNRGEVGPQRNGKSGTPPKALGYSVLQTYSGKRNSLNSVDTIVDIASLTCNRDTALIPW